jgi:hypothetical protein
MTASTGRLSIATVDDGAPRKDWFRVPFEVYADDPAWVPQLLFMEKQRISPRHNPFFAFGEASLFVAYRDGRPVGRISAQINRRYQEYCKSRTGHFGFFDCINDADAAGALVDAAMTWLKARGADRIEGPYSLSANQECGLLVEGFDTPPAMLMNHARSHMGGLLEQAGLTKVIDTFAFRMAPDHDWTQLDRLADSVREAHSVDIRKLDASRFEEEVRLVMDIFNDAWSENWGFVPFSEEEIKALIKELKPFFRPAYGRIASIRGEPVGLIMGMPDINGLIKDFGGRLLPLNGLKLIYGLWRETFHGFRIPLMGVRQKYRNPMMAGGIIAAMVSDILKERVNYDFEWIELSWVLETNRPMMSIATKAAGAPAKRYRIYGKALT